VAPDAIVYASAVVLVTVGMMLAWNRVQVRYGNLGVSQLPGLARPMPKFGFCLALLVMAAVGLPPFGLFFGYLGMLLASSTMSVGHVIVLFTWFGVSWYLFKLLQRLLFGPHRSDLRYDDLRPAEVLALAVILVLLVSLSVAPQDWFGAGVTEVARTVVEGRGV
jgi:NADH-quinone oxidoreductase subunit M